MTSHPFEGRTTRVIGLPQVLEVLTMTDAIAVQREAFRSLAAGRVTSAPNTWLRLPEQERRRGWLKILAGHDADSATLGVKILARFADNPPGANLGSLVVLFDDDDGFPVAIIDGVSTTAMRTGAGAGVAAEVLAAENPQHVALIGTGVVGWHSLHATILSRPTIASVAIYSRSAERREQTAERVRNEFGIKAVAVASVDRACAGAHIVITATNSSQPVLLPRHLAPGMLVSAMGIRTEVDPVVLAQAPVIPDGIDEAVGDGKFSVALKAGTVTRKQLGPELGALIDGASHHMADGISLFDSSGVVAQDLALAKHVFRRAEQLGVGTQVDLGLASALVG